MLTAEKCRAYATESELLGTNFQSIMALKWRSLANGLDRHHDQLSTADVDLVSRNAHVRRISYGFQIRNW
jgi:hypothetical protein